MSGPSRGVVLRDPDEQWRMQYVQQVGWKQGATVAASTLLDQFLVKREKAHQSVVAEVKAQRDAPPLSEWIAHRGFDLIPPKNAVRTAAWRWVFLRSWVLKQDFITHYVPPALVDSQNSVGRGGKGRHHKRGNTRPPPPQPEPLPDGASLQAQYLHLVKYRDALRAYLEFEVPTQPPSSSSATAATMSQSLVDNNSHHRPSTRSSSRRFKLMSHLREAALHEVMQQQGGLLDEDGMVLAAKREVELLVEAVEHMNRASSVDVNLRVDMPAEEKFQRRLWYGQRLRDGAYTVDSVKDQCSTFERERQASALHRELMGDPHGEYQSPHRSTLPHRRPHASAPVVVQERPATSMSFTESTGRSPSPYSPSVVGGRSPPPPSGGVTTTALSTATLQPQSKTIGGFVTRRIPALVRASLNAPKSLSRPSSSAVKMVETPATKGAPRKTPSKANRSNNATTTRPQGDLGGNPLDDALRVPPVAVKHRGALLVPAEHPIVDFSFMNLTHPAEILVLKPRPAVIQPITSTTVPATEHSHSRTKTTVVHPVKTGNPESKSTGGPSAQTPVPSVNWKLYDFGVAHNTTAQVMMGSRMHASSSSWDPSPSSQSTPTLLLPTHQDSPMRSQTPAVDDQLLRCMTDSLRGRLLTEDGKATLPVIPCEVLKLNNNAITNTRLVHAVSSSWGGSPSLTSMSSFAYFGLVLRRRFGEAALTRIQLLDLSENRLVALPLEVEELVCLTGLRLHGNRIATLASLEVAARETTLAATLRSITLHGNPLAEALGGAAGYNDVIKKLFPRMDHIDGRLLVPDE